MSRFKCTFGACKYENFKKEIVLDHINLNHSNEHKFNLKCICHLPKNCNSRFLSYAGLHNHVLKEHNETNSTPQNSTPQLKCSRCNEKLNTVKELKSHYLKHWAPYINDLHCIFKACNFRISAHETNLTKIKNTWYNHCSSYHSKLQTYGNKLK